MKYKCILIKKKIGWIYFTAETAQRRRRNKNHVFICSRRVIIFLKLLLLLLILLNIRNNDKCVNEKQTLHSLTQKLLNFQPFSPYELQWPERGEWHREEDEDEEEEEASKRHPLATHLTLQGCYQVNSSFFIAIPHLPHTTNSSIFYIHSFAGIDGQVDTRLISGTRLPGINRRTRKEDKVLHSSLFLCIYYQFVV